MFNRYLPSCFCQIIREGRRDINKVNLLYGRGDQPFPRAEFHSTVELYSLSKDDDVLFPHCLIFNFSLLLKPITPSHEDTENHTEGIYAECYTILV